MNIAFSTITCPNWDWQTVVARAREYGFDGVEIADTTGNADRPLGSGPLGIGAAELRRMFGDAGVRIACLAASAATAAFSADPENATRAADQVRRHIDMAAELECERVKIPDMQVQPRQNRAAAALALAGWLAPLGDYAAQRRVGIVVENRLSFRTARELWTVLEATAHPSIGASWDVASALSAGEQPAVSVPVLNLRIRHVTVSDARATAQGPPGAVYCKLGEGTVPVQALVLRLRGIGYQGYLTAAWPKATQRDVPEPQDLLSDAIKKLREWTKPYEPPAKPARPAAKAAPAKAGTAKPAAAKAAADSAIATVKQ
jgi:sugar phosphate isomerase/epimerase